MDVWVNGQKAQTVVSSCCRGMFAGRIRRRRHAHALRDRLARGVHRGGEQRQAAHGHRAQVIRRRQRGDEDRERVDGVNEAVCNIQSLNSHTQ